MPFTVVALFGGGLWKVEPESMPVWDSLWQPVATSATTAINDINIFILRSHRRGPGIGSSHRRRCSGRRRFIGGGWNPVLVSFAHPCGADLSDYQRVFQAPVVFEADRNALRTSRLSHQRHAVVAQQPGERARLIGTLAD